MRFRCENCGAALSVADWRARTTGRCPRCKKVVAIPRPTVEEAAVRTEESPEGTPAVKQTLRDPLLFDTPPAAEADNVEAACEELQALRGRYLLTEDQEPPERRLPWLIDIFLYPLNKSGLVILLLSAGVPFLLRIVLKFFIYFSGAFPPALIFWVLSIIAHWASFALFVLYMNWYLCQCIRDSAAGGIRAADTTASTPGLGELLGQAFVVIVTAAACLAPPLMYLAGTHQVDGFFWTLYGVGGFLFPMALLAVVLFESLRALNPFLLLGSICSAFFSYTVLVAFWYLPCLLIPVVGSCLFRVWILAYPLLFLVYYQLLILAHLLGRYYWNHQEKLNWEA